MVLSSRGLGVATENTARRKHGSTCIVLDATYCSHAAGGAESYDDGSPELHQAPGRYAEEDRLTPISRRDARSKGCVS